METRTFPRATEPHRQSLAAVLTPLIGGHAQRYDKGTLAIDAEFGAVTDAQVQALVDAAPEASVALDTKARIDGLSQVEKAIALTMLDLVNQERARHSAAAVTPAQFIAAVKARVDTLP